MRRDRRLCRALNSGYLLIASKPAQSSDMASSFTLILDRTKRSYFFDDIAKTCDVRDAREKSNAEPTSDVE